MPIKIRVNKSEDYKNILNDYDKYETMQVGKKDERDYIRGQMVLLGLSRELFTHSLPLIAAEQCYIKLLKDARKLLEKQENKIKKERTFELLVDLIEEYNIRLLSTKVYWDKPEEREEYKKFWSKYNEIQKIENEEEKKKQKEILFLKNDLKKLNRSKNNYSKIIKIIKEKLVEDGAIRQIKNTCKTMEGSYKKQVA